MAVRNVFISYSRRDRAYVDRLVAFLHDHHIPAWADSAINHGDHWEDVICQEIDDCAAFVPVMTPEAWASPWVRNEVARARLKDKPILPLLLEGEHFFGLSHLEAEDVTDGQLPRPPYVARLQGLVGSPGAMPPTRPSAPARRRRLAWLMPGLAAVAVLLVVGTILTLARRDPASGTPGANGSPVTTLPAETTGPAGPPVIEHLAWPETIGPFTLFTASPASTTNSSTFGYHIHDKTGSVSLVYQDPQNPTEQITILATTGTVALYAAIVDDYLTSMTRSTLHEVNPGRLSGQAKCGTLNESDGAVVGCAWADPGSIGVIYFNYRPQPECETLFALFRDAVLTRDS